MKSSIFYVLVIALIVGGIWMFKHKGDNNSGSTNEILKEKLEEILPGTWKIEGEEVVDKVGFGIDRFEYAGFVDYDDDGTFFKQITINKRKNSYISLTTGGSVKGLWSVSEDGKSWIETPKSCKDTIMYPAPEGVKYVKKSMCDFFPINISDTLGDKKTDFIRNKFEILNNYTLEYTGINIMDNGTCKFTYKREEGL